MITEGKVGELQAIHYPYTLERSSICAAESVLQRCEYAAYDEEQ